MRTVAGLVIGLVMLVSDGAGAVDFQEAVAPDPDDRSLQIGIWYPSGIAATRLPLVVLSHGSGGTFMDQRPTALALAEAGFIAVGALHTGDNYRDPSYVAKGTHLLGRPRHVARVIDYMLSSWPQRERIDPARIGIFGFSAGGFTALVVIGGQPDLSAAAGFCEQHPEDGDCALMRQNDLARKWQEQSPKNDWAHDPRVRAAVVVAPAVGYGFAPHGLSKVRVPVQLWAGARDRVVDTATKTAVVRKLLPQPPEYHEIEGATHFAFIGPCPPALLAIMTERAGTGEDNACLDPPGFDRAAFHASFNREVVRFLSEKLRREQLAPQPGVSDHVQEREAEAARELGPALHGYFPDGGSRGSATSPCSHSTPLGGKSASAVSAMLMKAQLATLRVSPSGAASCAAVRAASSKLSSRCSRSSTGAKVTRWGGEPRH